MSSLKINEVISLFFFFQGVVDRHSAIPRNTLATIKLCNDCYLKTREASLNVTHLWGFTKKKVKDISLFLINILLKII